jgi:hypothetical protein
MMQRISRRAGLAAVVAGAGDPRLIRVLTAGMQPGTFGLATPPAPMMQRISRRAGLAAVVAGAGVVSEVEAVVGRHNFATVVNGHRCRVRPLTITVDHFRGGNFRNFN